jgi:hypothetical protein
MLLAYWSACAVKRHSLHDRSPISHAQSTTFANSTVKVAYYALRLRGIALTLLVVGGVVATTASANQAIDDCLQTEDFAAVPNDGADDRVQLQAAIDAAQTGPRCLAIGQGTFHSTRKPTPGTASIPSLRITRTLTLRGAGADATVLAMLGSGILPEETAPRDWRLLKVSGAADVSISDLRFDGSARTATGEQTHLLHLIGPTKHVVVERASLTLPEIGPTTGGDCIRLLSQVGALVRDTTIRDVTGPDCDRSFISLQRGVDGLVIERSESVRVRDQAIDFEPTNGESFQCQPSIKTRQASPRRRRIALIRLANVVLPKG